MAIETTNARCIDCNEFRQQVYNTGKCIICTRLDSLEKNIKELEDAKS